jgi:hypothetical protein
VLAARLESSGPPPAPGVGLRALTWGIHHPNETATILAGALGLAAILAVVTRRKPRA